jgi:hypothetical protein
VQINGRLPYHAEEDVIQEVCALMRRLRDEFAPDVRAAHLRLDRDWIWTPKVVARMPLAWLTKLLGEDAARVSFPVQKVFRPGEDSEYDARGKTCGDVMEEQRELLDWAIELLLQKPEDELDHVDKLGLAAMSALVAPPEDF